MRTITLELLRHGPAHNQLLSPVTQYLALCENESAVTIRVPFEHSQMLYRLRALSYTMGEESRQFQLKDTAQVLGALLSEIPGLTAAMNRFQPGTGQEATTHLRLVLSASELALLPFELALAPLGFPGAGQPLLLQSQMPLCVTRETRRVPEEFIEWPDRPRVLFVSASSPGYEAVPAGAHLLALRKALQPWIGLSAVDDDATRSKQVSRHLSVLCEASIESIERACAAEAFTHIHILAHGHERQEAYDVRFGLALHDSNNPLGPADIVSGERLATALRVSKRGGHERLSRPAVVTLASCNSGNVGTVTSAGASVAHALHEAGIPLIIASQFPLSFGGSVRMVEALYEGLLFGEDPRGLLIDLRRQLHTEFPATHDWASITGYASLPPGFERQLATAQIRRAEAGINEALRVADAVTRRFSLIFTTHSAPERLAGDQDTEKQTLLDSTGKQVSAAKKRLENLLHRYPAEQAKISALLASSEKREAEIQYARRSISRLTDEQREQARDAAIAALARARHYYWSAFQTDRSNYWTVIQYLSLTVILEKTGQLAPMVADPQQTMAALWRMAEIQSLEDLQNDDRNTRIWALGNLVELYILAPLIADVLAQTDLQALNGKAATRAKEVAAAAGRYSFGVFSTRRQVARYMEWYNDLTQQALAPLVQIAQAVFAQLPEQDEPDWAY